MAQHEAQKGLLDPSMATKAGNGHAEEEAPETCYKQNLVKKIYKSLPCEVGVAVLIGANFLTNMVEKEIDPQGNKYEATWSVFELFYNIAFTLELGVNLYAHWWKEFWRSGWNIFDVVVVSIGVINTVKLPLPDAFSMLRMMRAFRVFRLFKRVEALNKIITAIFHAVPGVINAFFILGIVMAIFAILAVEFYWDIGAGCWDEDGDPKLIKWRTPRGNCLGDEYFGTFSKSLYSFFQVLTGESWSEMVARPAMWYFYDEPLKVVGGGIFFVSYVLITAFMLANVVVAVLLDKMSDPGLSQGPEEEAEAAASPDTSNGKEEIVIVHEHPEEPSKAVSKLEGKVESLLGSSTKMDDDLTRIKTEMAAMREQLNTIFQFVS